MEAQDAGGAEWTVRSPAIARKSSPLAAAGVLIFLAAAAVVLWRRRRPD
jgi:LPXTG-motif cell wall-anchored protein